MFPFLSEEIFSTLVIRHNTKDWNICPNISHPEIITIWNIFALVHWIEITTFPLCMLGKIYEQHGNTAKAVEHYEKFLSLWKEAVPGIAEVGHARKRLAELKSQ